LGQAQSFETDHAQLDDIHLLQLKKIKTFLSHLFPHIFINCCCEIYCSNKSFRTRFGLLLVCLEVKQMWSSIWNQYNCSSQRASEVRAAWLMQL